MPPAIHRSLPTEGTAVGDHAVHGSCSLCRRRSSSDFACRKPRSLECRPTLGEDCAPESNSRACLCPLRSALFPLSQSTLPVSSFRAFNQPHRPAAGKVNTTARIGCASPDHETLEAAGPAFPTTVCAHQLCHSASSVSSAIATPHPCPRRVRNVLAIHGFVGLPTSRRNRNPAPAFSGQFVSAALVALSSHS